jgi:hypothetical protein
VPKITSPTIKGLPFSYEFVSQCLFNGLHRENHGTLDNSDLPKLFAVLFKFMLMNKNIAYDEDLLDRFYLNDFW